MDKAQLLQLKEKAVNEFERLQKEAEAHRQKILEIEDELKRLQGDFRTYEGLLKSIEDKPQEANTIEAKPKGKK